MTGHRRSRCSPIRLRLLAEQLYAGSHSAANEVCRGYLRGDTTNALVHFRHSLVLSPHNNTSRG